MHRLLVIIIVFSLGFSASAEPLTGVNLQVIDNHSMGLTVKFDLSETSTNVKDVGFTPLDMTFSDDAEHVPVFSRLISVPMGYKPVVRMLERKSTHLVSQQVSYDNNPIPISSAQIANLSLNPPDAVVCGEVDMWRGRTIAPMTIYPVQKVADDNAVIENEVLEFEIVFEPNPHANNFRPFNDIPGNNLGRMIDNIILNHDSDDCVDMQQAHRGRMLILLQEYPREGDDLLFLNDAIPAINSLAEWKRSMGYRVEVVPVEFRNVSPQEIKDDIIRPRYEDQADPLTYLLLIGGKEPNGQVYFPTFNPAGPGEEGDHHYSYLGENPYLSDIAIGRMEAISIRQLKNTIRRNLSYEMDPFVEPDEHDENGGEWFERALFTAENIAAPGGQFVPSMIHLGRWVVDKLEQYGYESVDTLWVSNRNENVDEQVQEIVENGTGLSVSRGWLNGCHYQDGDDFVNPRNGRKFPFVLAVTCLSYTTQEGFFQSATNQGERGPIATIAMKGLSHTTPNNSLLGGSLRGIVHFDLHQTGLIQMFGKYQMWTDQRYHLGALALDNVAVFRLMGDPTTEIITGIPITLESNYPEQISIGATGFSVEVVSDGEVVPDAWVSIYQADGIHLVCQPCEDGWARFTFNPGELNEGDLGVTITRYNALPIIDTISVTSDGNRVDLTDVQFDNEDGLFASGDNIPTTLTFTNNSDNDIENAVVTLTTDDEHITFSEEQFEIGDFSAGEDLEVSFGFEIDWSSKFGRTVRIQATVSSGQESWWENAFSFESSGHELALLGNPDPDNQFRSGIEADFIPRLRNTGDRPTIAMTGTLTSLSPFVTVVDGIRSYDVIGEVQGIGAPNRAFTVNAGDLSINGSVAKFMLSLTADNQNIEFEDHVYFEVVIGEADVTDPYGPDEYGYIMFDSGDTDWAKAPAYDWIEINPNKNEGAIEGTLLDFGDIRVDLDSTIAVDLPFNFQYYGEDFDTIAVNSNAWLAFGADKTQYLDFRNQQIPGIQGPDAMVALFWQDLVNYLDNDLSGVYYYYDEEAGLFIIEWSDMRVYQDFGESLEAQIILYDPTVYTTSTGDGEIKLQYKTASRADGDHTDNQYCTVGIKNLDGTGGLEYVYWDQYPAANNPLEDEMAILVTTDRFSAIGGIEGSVTREEDHNVPIEGAVVRALRSGFDAITDVNGNFTFESVLAGRERVSVSKDGFNTMILAVDVMEGEISMLTARMTHPQIVVPNDPIERGLHTGNYGVTFDFSFENQGNGALTYDFSSRYLDGSATEFAQTWKANLSTLVNDDNFLVGCQFVGDSIYVTSKVSRGDADEMIYIYERDDDSGDPTFVNSFLQPSRSEDGFRDLAYDGEYLYGGEIRLMEGEFPEDRDSLFIVKFDKAGNFVDEIFLDVEIDTAQGNRGHPVPFDEPSVLAYSPRDSTLITTNGQNDIFVYNMAGDLVNQVNLYFPGEVIDIQGLAWNDSDEDDMPLYIIDTDNGIRLSKASLETGESMIVGEMDGFIRDRPLGLTIGYDFDTSVISMATIAGGPGNLYNDSLRVYELGPDSHYLRINPKHGIVPSGQTAIITMEMRSTGLAEGEYSHGIAITHDGSEDEVFLVSTLIVNDTLRTIGNGNTIPKEFSLEQAYPNPFNNTTRIDFSLTTAAHTELIIYDISGRKVAELVNEKLEIGRYTALFRPEIQASGIYIYQLKSSGNSAVKRMVYLK